MSLYTVIKTCRVCGSGSIVEVMHFGQQFLASSFVHSNDDHPLAQIKVPLSVVLCRSCGLVQLQETVNRDRLFHDYFYRSGTNPMMREALKEVVDEVTRRVDLKQGDLVVDTGCNDATMLTFFPESLQRVGIEPATNIDWSDLDKSIQIVNDYFSAAAVNKATGGAKCKLLTSIAMFYSVEDLNRFVAEAKFLLSEDGVWCIQLSYLPATIERLSFFDVCHEHLYYFSLKTLNYLLERNGLTIFDASLNDVNGGSLRVFATHRENTPAKSDRVLRLEKAEENLRLDQPETFQMFFRRVLDLKESVVSYISKIKQNRELVIGLGASTKGNVLLQFFGIDKFLLPYISERNPEKVSLRTLGTDIELISEEKARELNPAAMLVLIWFFKDELIKREQDYLKQGGKLLFPMPYLHIVSADGEKRL